MAVVGIDLGSQSTKVVIVEGDEIVGGASLSDRGIGGDRGPHGGRGGAASHGPHARGPEGRGGHRHAQRARHRGRDSGARRRAASPLGAHFRFPQARTVLYIGADSSMAIRMSADGQVEDSVKNERCAVSSGALLDIVGRMLEIPVEELGPLSLQATAPQTVSSRCVVFAEGEILSFIHKDPPVPVPDALAGVNQCIADGLWGMVRKVGVPSELLLCGGVARNVGIVKAIEAHLGKPALVPPEPQYVRALGAALFARQLQQEGGAPC